MSDRNLLIKIVVTSIFFIFVFLLLFSSAMHHGFSQDESQFVSSGVLLERKLLLPYKDYPYFHMPNLIFIYAVLFKFSDYILLIARIYSTLCSFGCIIIIFYITYFLFLKHNTLIRSIICMCSVILIIMNPLFIYTTGYAINHDPSVFFALLAFLIHCHVLRDEKGEKWLLASGISLGLATGIRLSFALCIIPFLISILLFRRSRERKNILLVTYFIGGHLLALLPSLILFMYRPLHFMFGNLYFRKLDSLHYQSIGYGRMTIIDKFKHLISDVIFEPATFALVVVFMFCVVGPYIWALKKQTSTRFEVSFILILLPFLLLGSIVPTPTVYQYYYALVPFVFLGILYKVSSSYNRDVKFKIIVGGFVFFTVLSCIFGIPRYKHIQNLSRINEWYPIKVHRFGVTMADIVGEGKVLTFLPIFVLEGGLEIYEEFATGKFAYRAARFLNQRNRKKFRMISVDDLYDFLKERPPKGVLLSFGREKFERRLESSLENYAEDKNHVLFKLDGRRLWIFSE